MQAPLQQFFVVATLLIKRAIVASFPAETIQKTFYLTTESMQ